jgi:hypothetical protein
MVLSIGFPERANLPEQFHFPTNGERTFCSGFAMFPPRAAGVCALVNVDKTAINDTDTSFFKLPPGCKLSVDEDLKGEFPSLTEE